LDLKDLNEIVWLDLKKKQIKVQSGTTWNQIQQHIDPFDLSIAEMQSYRNFSVGGSISVNCHGRGLEYGTISDTIQMMDVILADGTIVQNLSKESNPLLFQAIVGGYGSVGLILNATIQLTNNIVLKRVVENIRTVDFDENFIQSTIESDPDLIFYNGSIYPSNENKILNVHFYKATTTNHHHNTLLKRLRKQKEFYLKSVFCEILINRFDFAKSIRADVEPILLADEKIVSRNYEMSYDTKKLNPFKYPHTSILEEYFVPISNANKFLIEIIQLIQQAGEEMNVLNLSIRYVKKITHSILNYAKSNSISFVLYCNIENNPNSIGDVQYWTRKLIQRVLFYGGTYYLPYLPFATIEQFRKAYPEYRMQLKVKRQYDPQKIFCSQFIRTYFS